MSYRIWCEVWGGVTGHRTAWLKDNDRIAEFDSLAEAQAEARRLSQEMNGNPYRKANFSYEAREVEG